MFMPVHQQSLVQQHRCSISDTTGVLDLRSIYCMQTDFRVAWLLLLFANCTYYLSVFLSVPVRSEGISYFCISQSVGFGVG